MIYNNDINEIIKDIKHKMLDNNINNNDIAAIMGKSKQTISNILNGRQPNMTLGTLYELCKAIDCRLDISIIPIDNKND
jgi:DNA-binding Xre family transcriptional regulator